MRYIVRHLATALTTAHHFYSSQRCVLIALPVQFPARSRQSSEILRIRPLVECMLSPVRSLDRCVQRRDTGGGRYTWGIPSDMSQCCCFHSLRSSRGKPGRHCWGRVRTEKGGASMNYVRTFSLPLSVMDSPIRFSTHMSSDPIPPVHPRATRRCCTAIIKVDMILYLRVYLVRVGMRT